MLTHEEIVRRLALVVQGLQAVRTFRATVSRSLAEDLLKALESESEPLAVVEGWIEVPRDLNWIPQSLYTLTGSRAWEPQIPVTVTITERRENKDAKYDA